MELNLIKTTQIDFYYIITEQHLNFVCENLKKQTVLACDTETCIDEKKKNPNPLDPHSSTISLFQINYPNNFIPFIIDVLVIGVDKCRPLVKILLEENILKIFHYASFDLKQIKSTFGIWANNVRCTQIMMRSLGVCTGFKASNFRGHRLADLSRDIFDIHLEKTQATSQWRTRPLTMDQLIYSALDVGAPKGSFNKYTKTPLDSIVIRGYQLYDNELKTLGQSVVVQADQRGMYVTAKLEFNGMYIDRDWLKLVHAYASEKASTTRKILCDTLNLEILQELEVTDDGEFVMKQIIPEKTKKLLNSSKNLIEYINVYLENNNLEPLNNLQKEGLANYLEELSKNDIADEEHEAEENKYSQEMLKTLLTYKKFAKLESECDKYFSIINQNTGCVHAGFNSVGAATGRMSSSGDLNLQQVSNVIVNLELTKKSFG